jgi:hypothetical protein
VSAEDLIMREAPQLSAIADVVAPTSFVEEIAQSDLAIPFGIGITVAALAGSWLLARRRRRLAARTGAPAPEAAGAPSPRDAAP